MTTTPSKASNSPPSPTHLVRRHRVGGGLDEEDLGQGRGARGARALPPRQHVEKGAGVLVFVFLVGSLGVGVGVVMCWVEGWGRKSCACTRMPCIGQI